MKPELEARSQWTLNESLWLHSKGLFNLRWAMYVSREAVLTAIKFLNGPSEPFLEIKLDCWLFTSQRHRIQRGDVAVACKSNVQCVEHEDRPRAGQVALADLCVTAAERRRRGMAVVISQRRRSEPKFVANWARAFCGQLSGVATPSLLLFRFSKSHSIQSLTDVGRFLALNLCWTPSRPHVSRETGLVKFTFAFSSELPKYAI